MIKIELISASRWSSILLHHGWRCHGHRAHPVWGSARPSAGEGTTPGPACSDHAVESPGTWLKAYEHNAYLVAFYG